MFPQIYSSFSDPLLLLRG